MALKFDFDWKTFLMQKGEKIGLRAGAGILGLMAIVGLKDAFSASPGTNAENLNKKTEAAKKLIASNTPKDLTQFQVDKELMETKGDLPPIPPDEFRAIASLYVPFAPVDAKRGDPRVESPTEMVVMVASSQGRGHMFSEDRKEVMTLKGEGSKDANANAQQRLTGGMGMLG